MSNPVESSPDFPEPSSPDSTPTGAPASNGAPPAKPRVKARWLLVILALTFLFVLMPFLFWQATWFGRPLDDQQIAAALDDREEPRQIQYALSQIADRILSPN